MMDIATTADEWLKTMAAESARHAENLRGAVRDLTLQAMQGRELTLSQIRDALRGIAQAVNLGSTEADEAPEEVLSGALAGMDEALLDAVQASRAAISGLVQAGDFERSPFKQVLDEIERLEDSFYGAMRETAAGVGDRAWPQWDGILARGEIPGAATLQDYGRTIRDAVRESRVATFKAAHQLTQSVATLASNVLVGLSEGLSRTAARPSGTPTRHERPERPERPERSERSERPERPERPRGGAPRGKRASAAAAKRTIARRPGRARKTGAKRARR